MNDRYEASRRGHWNLESSSGSNRKRSSTQTSGHTMTIRKTVGKMSIPCAAASGAAAVCSVAPLPETGHLTNTYVEEYEKLVLLFTRRITFVSVVQNLLAGTLSLT